MSFFTDHLQAAEARAVEFVIRLNVGTEDAPQFVFLRQQQTLPETNTPIGPVWTNVPEEARRYASEEHAQNVISADERLSGAKAIAAP